MTRGKPSGARIPAFHILNLEIFRPTATRRSLLSSEQLFFWSQANLKSSFCSPRWLMNPSSPNNSGRRSARVGEVPPISIFSRSRSSRVALSVPGNYFGLANSISCDSLQVEIYMRGRGSQPRQRHQYLLEKSGEGAVLHTSRGDGWLKEGNDRGHHCHVPENRVLSGKMSQALS